MKHSLLSVLFTVVMLIFALFIVWYVPTAANQRAQLTDLDLSLETSYGRERKQQAEYDEVVLELPEIRSQLEKILPESQAAEQAKEELKAQKKALKAEKQALEDAAAENPVSGEMEENSHE